MPPGRRDAKDYQAFRSKLAAPNAADADFDTALVLDEGSLRRLTSGTIDAGVNGITVLGVAGEAHKLVDVERQRVLEIVMDVNAGRVLIIVGTSREGTEATIATCLEAEVVGAAGFMIVPPTFVQPGRDSPCTISASPRLRTCRLSCRITPWSTVSRCRHGPWRIWCRRSQRSRRSSSKTCRPLSGRRRPWPCSWAEM